MSAGTDYSKLLFHDTICNYIVECEDSNKSLGIPYVEELKKQAKKLVRLIQYTERNLVEQIMEICQKTVGGMEYLGMVQYTYYGVPTSLDIFREKGIIYMQFRWKPLTGIQITESGFLDIGRPVVPVNRVSSTNSILENIDNAEKLRAFQALEFKSYESKGYSHAIAVNVNKDKRDRVAEIMGNFYIPELENDILEFFGIEYNRMMLHCLTDRSDQLIRNVKESFQILVTDLEDNLVPELMILNVMNYVGSEISSMTTMRVRSSNTDKDDEEEER